MKLLDRYLAVTVGKAIMMTLVVLTVLTFVLTFIEEMDDVGRGDYRVVDAFIVALSITPRFIYEAFPVSALIGALLGLGGMANQGELVAMRAAGVSLNHIVAAVIKLGIFLMLIVVLIGDLAAPVTERFGQQLRLEKQHKQITMRSKYGFWAKDGNAVVNIRAVLPGGQLKHVYIYEFSDQNELKLVTFAGRGDYQDGKWLLKGVRQSSIAESGVATRRLRQAAWSSILDPALLSVIVVKPFMLPMWELYDYVEVMKRNNQDATNYEVAFWTKLATPIATIAMLVLTVPFVLGSVRSVSLGQRIFAGVLFGTLFYLFSRGYSFLVVVYDLYPFTVAVFPVLVFLLAGSYLLRRKPA